MNLSVGYFSNIYLYIEDKGRRGTVNFLFLFMLFGGSEGEGNGTNLFPFPLN